MTPSKCISVYHGFGSGLGIQGIASSEAGGKNSGCLFRDVTIVERTINALLKYPSAALTPCAVVCSGVTAFRTFHNLGTCTARPTPTPTLLFRTSEAVSQTDVGDGLAMRLTGCIRTAQPGGGTISRSLPPESTI